MEFGWEETGRYGGVGAGDWPDHRREEPQLDDHPRRSDRLRQGRIDVLKVDIEGLEETVIGDIPATSARHINKIYVEFNFAANPLASTHALTQYGEIAQFVACQESDPATTVTTEAG